MNEEQFKSRTKQLALRVIRLIEALPNNRTANVIGNQLLRSATSVGANYRAACRAKSTADLIAKLSIVEEEADETIYWLELLVESSLISFAKLKDLMQEASEILAMTVASIKTLRSKEKQSKIQNSKSKSPNN
ncbi:MAG: four helix bundle protein [Calothrix sp. MO_167.B42]|nr:four helix bundle protein [Calothrix sp. MO_167.B42]